MYSRRRFLVSAAAATIASAPRRAYAADSERNFIFVFAKGGWDTTRVFTPAFDNEAVDLEMGAALSTVGNLSYVDHPLRPSVQTFFEANYRRMALVNGVLVPSIAHDRCRALTLTGGTDTSAPDWGSRIGGASARLLPYLVVGGPSFSGPTQTVTARAGTDGQLGALLAGDGGAPLSADGESSVDRLVARRAAALASGAPGALTAEFEQATLQMQELKRYASALRFGEADTFEGQAACAVQALSSGLCRCVMTRAGGFYGNWDTHANNDQLQSALFEQLFGDLVALMAALDATPGLSAATLAEETTVVVLSEMGRTPRYASGDGKDHWPWTSAMLIGAGIAGDQTIGGHDEAFAGLTVDAASGTTVHDGEPLTFDMLGATLLALADVDPAESMPGVPVLETLLAG